MRKAEVIDRLRTTRGELEELLAAMTSAQMQRPGVAGDWSVKDVLAHILWYAREELELIRESGAAASALWDVPPGEVDAADPLDSLAGQSVVRCTTSATRQVGLDLFGTTSNVRPGTPYVLFSDARPEDIEPDGQLVGRLWT
jgi:hypothetical protein